LIAHGGALSAASRRYGCPVSDWLDLSTGINPRGYPVPPLSADCWRRLPEDEDGLEEAAADYYGAPRALALAVPGSQRAIELLPTLFLPGRVLVLAPSYEEHAAAWHRAGHELNLLAAGDAENGLETAAAGCDTVLLCHPNNPTGQRFRRERLLELGRTLAGRGGRLVVDEAFMDAEPADSLASCSGDRGIIVLRSLGKFFGLAGARVGFVLAEETLLARLREAIGPWPVAGPARAVALAALSDRAWQQATRQQLVQDGERLAALLRSSGLGDPRGTPLFQWLPHSLAVAIHDCLARQAILVRLFPQSASLRFGLPPDEAGWRRLANALNSLECGL
jgi:cobalamin biosynthesis protein CobC